MGNEEWIASTNQRLDAIDAKIEELKQSVQSLVKLCKQKEFSTKEVSSFDPADIKPYTEGDKRSVPAFIEEFENCTFDLEDGLEKGSYFRRLFQITHYPKSATMPKNKPYAIMKDWFLRTAWDEKARKAYALQICTWTQASTGTETITDFVRYLNAKLIECQVSQEFRWLIIQEMVPSRVERLLNVSSFDTLDTLNNALDFVDTFIAKNFHFLEGYSFRSN